MGLASPGSRGSSERRNNRGVQMGLREEGEEGTSTPQRKGGSDCGTASLRRTFSWLHFGRTDRDGCAISREGTDHSHSMAWRSRGNGRAPGFC